ncbi:MAG: epimerase [Deltaproteobacteria bacterium]|nr:MAG: epimerase [Deltaproteobacteria bacterium]
MSSSRVAFVAGATGYTGQAVVRRLVADGVRVVAHVRPDSPRLGEWCERFIALGAEVNAAMWTGPEMGDAIRELGVTEVYGLTGTTMKRARSLARSGGDAADASHEAVDYGLTRHLVDASVAAGTRPWLVYLSSLGASPSARGSYLRARGRAEVAIQEADLPWSILRASFITGPDRGESRPAERVGAVLGNGLLAVAAAFGGKRLRERYRSIDADGLAAILVALPGDEARQGQVLTLDALRG